MATKAEELRRQRATQFRTPRSVGFAGERKPGHRLLRIPNTSYGYVPYENRKKGTWFRYDAIKMRWFYVHARDVPASFRRTPLVNRIL